jgi:hypothetical protein
MINTWQELVRTVKGYLSNCQSLSITPETGKLILNWCQTGIDITAEHITERIGECKSIEHLLSLYKMFPQHQTGLKPEFERKKRELILTAP